VVVSINVAKCSALAYVNKTACWTINDKQNQVIHVDWSSDRLVNSLTANKTKSDLQQLPNFLSNIFVSCVVHELSSQQADQSKT